MIKFSVLTGVILLGMAAMATAHAGDAVAGQKLFGTTCIACHGANGISIATIYPNLAGQKADYLVAQLKAFRDGTRPNPIMGPMAKGLTDADIDNLAAYISTLKGQ
ncbi:MAG: cytochrome c [Gammaproteobacteria bacterium]|nr:cytochrome c [Gammaproteobacteria bacterium]